MARKKSTVAAVVPEDAFDAVAAGPTLEPVKVNNANASELKIACDDAVRRVRMDSRNHRIKPQLTSLLLAAVFIGNSTFRGLISSVRGTPIRM